jgi:hypothetical protein
MAVAVVPLIGRLIHAEEWSPYAIAATYVLFFSSAIEVIPVTVALVSFSRQPELRTGRNILFTLIGVIALLPAAFLSAIVAIAT